MATYLGDPREGCLSHERPYALELEGHDHPHYQWGAMILDLCGMDPGKYATTIFYVSGATSDGTGSITGNTTNPIKVSFSTDESGVTVTATANKDVSSDVVVVVSLDEVTDESGNTITLDTTEEAVVMTIASSTKMASYRFTSLRSFKTLSANVYVGPTKEEATSSTYKDEENSITYETTDVVITDFMAYYGVYPTTASTDDLSVDTLVNGVELTEEITDKSVEFLINCYQIGEYPIDGTDEEIDEYDALEKQLQAATSFNFVIIAPEDATIKAMIAGGLGDDTANFVKVKTVDGMTYYLKDADAHYPSADENSQLGYEYTLTIKK